MGLAAFNRMRRQKAEQEARESAPVQAPEPQPAETKPVKPKRPAKAKE